MAYDEKRVKQMQDHLAGKTQLAGDDLKSADYNADGKFNIKDVTAYQKQYADKDPVKEIATEKYDAQQEKPIKVMPYATKDGVPIMYSDKERADNPDVVYPDKQWQAQNASIVDEAMNKLNSQLGSVSQWDSKAMGVLNELENKEDFKYDLQGDVLYQQYKEQYIDNADRAMRDTVGQVSSMTGGYGNSYAQTAGQQTYNEVMGGLNDIVPELYQIAQERYDAELQNKKDMLGIYQGMSDIAYGRERDKAEDAYREKVYDRGVYESDRDYDRGVLESDRNYDYQVGRDEIEDAYRDKVFDREVLESDRDYNRGVLESDRNYNYQVGRDEVEDAYRDKVYDRGVLESDREYNYGVNADEQERLATSGQALLNAAVMPSKEQLNALGMTEKQAQEYITRVLALESVSSGGGSGSTGSSKSSSYSNTYLKQLYKDGDYDAFFSALAEKGDVVAEAQALGLSKHEINFLNDEKLTSVEQAKYMLKNHGKDDYSDKDIERMLSGAYSESEFYSFANYNSEHDTYADYLTAAFKRFIKM